MSERKPPSDDLIGKVLGHFEILDEVGRGGMATVYRAKQINMNRVVAVKVLPRHFLHDPGFYERFAREVDVISHLEHPHILPIYDYGEAEGLPYIAMRYLGGGSMAQMIRRGIQPLETLDKPFSQVASALDYAHQQGIIHRDLKPGNIMLDEHGNAYLTDFGIARVLGSDLTGSAIIGTPAYMSPEQANGLPIDARSDIYALGIVLFELITGREPYQAETPMALLLKHINEPIPLVRSFREDVPDSVEEVIGRATAKDPGERYSSAGEMAAAFSDSVRSPDSTRSGRPATQTRQPPPPVNVPVTPPPPATAPYPPTTPAPTGGYTPTMQGYPPTTPYPATGIQPRQGLSPAVIIGIVAAIAIIAVAAVLVLPGLLNHPVTPVVTAAPLPLPTPFPNSVPISVQDGYTLSIPSAWIPNSDGYIKQTGSDFVKYLWCDQRKGNECDPNSNVVTGLIIPNARFDTDAGFQNAVRGFKPANYSSLLMQSIDETTAPDGTIRHSYRSALKESALPTGQTDLFYIYRAPVMVVLEMYASDGVGDVATVKTFQAMLNSLRVKTTS